MLQLSICRALSPYLIWRTCLAAHKILAIRARTIEVAGKGNILFRHLRFHLRNTFIRINQRSFHIAAVVA